MSTMSTEAQAFEQRKAEAALAEASAPVEVEQEEQA